MGEYRLTREQRAARAEPIAQQHGGVAHRAELRAAGISRADVRSEVRAGRWFPAGRHTVVVHGTQPVGEGLLWRAVWESGAGAVLDGASALVAGGLIGFENDRIDVSVPANNRRHPVPGVRIHVRRSLGMVRRVGLPRARPEAAVLRAAQWAASDRTAALLICMVVQQRLVSTDRLLAAWRAVVRSRRRALIDSVVRDVCDGVHSLAELDFAALCRRRGLPEPSRQVVRALPGGRVYLDVAWDDIALVVEIDGGHHAAGLATLDDALRQNDVSLRDATVLRIPVLGLRLMPEQFMDQVAEAHRLRRPHAA